jgi:hypothetical protein
MPVGRNEWASPPARSVLGSIVPPLGSRVRVPSLPLTSHFWISSSGLEPEGSHGDRSDLVQLLHGRSAGRVGTTIETIAVDSSLHDVPDAARMLVTASGFPADLPLRGSRDEHRRARPAGKGDPLLPDRGLADPGLPDGLFAARQGHLGSDSQTS